MHSVSIDSEKMLHIVFVRSTQSQSFVSYRE